MGSFGAIFLQNGEVQCTGKLQGTHPRGHVNSHNAAIGLLKFAVMMGNAGSGDGQNGQFWGNFSQNLGGVMHLGIMGHPSRGLRRHARC